MPCCNSLLSISTPATSRSSSTPSWLHRLHASKGLSFPSHLHLDDLFLPPSSSSTSSPHVLSSDAVPPMLLLPPPPPPSSSSSHPPIPNPSLISSALSDLFVMPSPPPPPPLLKSLRKQSRPRAARSPPPPRAHQTPDKTKPKLRKRRLADRAAAGEDDGEGERCTRTELTVIDTSTEGWKAAKLLLRRGAVWKVRNTKRLEASSGALGNRRRKAGLVGKHERDKEKEEKDASLGDIHATGGDAKKESDDLIRTLKRPRCSGPVQGGKSSPILRLQITNRGKKNGLAGPKDD